MILIPPVYEEIREKIISTLSLASTVQVVKATKFIRDDWRSLVEIFEKTGANGIKPPWVVMRVFPQQPAEWGMQNNAFHVPIEIFVVQKEANRVKTTVTETETSVHIAVTSLENVFVGQRVYFKTADVYRTITGTLGSQIVLDSSVSATLGEVVLSDITDDLEILIEQLRTAFNAGTTFTHFQLVDDPVSDVSDLNAVNIEMGGNNQFFFSGSLTIRPLVGESYE